MNIGVVLGIGFGALKRILGADNFNRPDNTATVGKDNTGKTWLTQGIWGLLNNQAYCSNLNGNTLALLYYDVGVSDYAVTAKVIWGSNEGLTVRGSDTGNYLTARIANTGLGLFRVVAGVSTSIGNYSFTPVVSNPYTLKIIATGSKVRVILDGIEQINVTETFNQSGKLVGLRAVTAGSGYFDDFIAEAA